MTWKTALIVCFGLALGAEGHAQSRLSESSFDTFVTDGKDLRDRITLVGAPSRRKLDTLLPTNATRMFRVVVSCSIDKTGMPTRCRKDRSFPDQFGDVAVALEALKESSASTPDAAMIRENGLRLQVVVYLDDPARPLDRYNSSTVPTLAPAPDPSSM